MDAEIHVVSDESSDNDSSDNESSDDESSEDESYPESRRQLSAALMKFLSIFSRRPLTDRDIILSDHEDDETTPETQQWFEKAFEAWPEEDITNVDDFTPFFQSLRTNELFWYGWVKCETLPDREGFAYTQEADINQIFQHTRAAVHQRLSDMTE